jgi:hypothetical protein
MLLHVRLARASAIAMMSVVLSVSGAAATGLSHGSRAAKQKLPPSPSKLTATVSSANRVSLTNSHGLTVHTLKAGWYTLLIRVETRAADFHIVGPNTNRRTSKRFLGDELWGVHFVRGTYRYMTDAKATATTHRVSVS